MLALEVAEKIAGLEAEGNDESDRAAEIAESVTSLRRSVVKAENGIKRLRQQVDTIKATESVQKAQMAVARRQGGGDQKRTTALEALARLPSRQEHTQAELEAYQAMEQQPSDLLEDKLKAAGIIEGDVSAESVLERLKEKQGAAEENKSSDK